MTVETIPAVYVEKIFAASCERVFDAWFDLNHIASWMFPSEEVVTLRQNPKVGETFNFIIRRQGKEIEHSGKYLEISRPQFLTFTWEVPQISLVPSTVRITIELFGEGSKLTLTHKDVLPEYHELTKVSWTQILDNLDKELN